MNKENTMRHTATRKRLYRSRNGIIWGVCQGLADWLEVSVGIVRTICIVILVLSGFFPLAAIYALVALLIPVEPATHKSYNYSFHEHNWDSKFYHT